MSLLGFSESGAIQRDQDDGPLKSSGRTLHALPVAITFRRSISEEILDLERNNRKSMALTLHFRWTIFDSSSSHRFRDDDTLA